MQSATNGWWNDSAMFGVIGRQPELLKKIVPVFEAFFMAGRLPASLFELMRLKTGEINQCAYCATVRAAGVRDAVRPKEAAVFGEIDPTQLSRREWLGVRLAEYVAGDPNFMRMRSTIRGSRSSPGTRSSSWYSPAASSTSATSSTSPCA